MVCTSAAFVHFCNMTKFCISISEIRLLQSGLRVGEGGGKQRTSQGLTDVIPMSYHPSTTLATRAPRSRRENGASGDLEWTERGARGASVVLGWYDIGTTSVRRR